MSFIKERCLEIAKYKGISKDFFAQKIGMTYGNFKGKAKNTPLNSNTIENILSIYPDINPDWLLTGRGAMLRSDAADISASTINNKGKIGEGEVYNNTAQAQEQNNHHLLSHQEALMKQIERQSLQITQLLAQIDRKDEEIQRLRAQAPPTI